MSCPYCKTDGYLNVLRVAVKVCDRLGLINESAYFGNRLLRAYCIRHPEMIERFQ